MKNYRRSRLSFNFYFSGTVSPDGELWLITQYRDIYPHRFSENGDLLNRYKLVNRIENLRPIFDIYFTEKRVYIVNSDSKILLYSF